MLGFTAFGVASFGQSTTGAPVVVLTTVGAITTTLAGTAQVANAVVALSTIGLVNVTVGNIGGVAANASITPTGVSSIFTLSSLTPFTWTDISDTVGESWSVISTTGSSESWSSISTTGSSESWSSISTTGSSESWTEVEDDSTNEATTWTDA